MTTTVTAVKRLLLIRHGQSEWNAQGRWQGQADPPLTDLGRHQAAQAVDSLTEFGFSGVVTSALERARVTGEVIAQGLGLAAPTIEPLLNERSAGEWSGLTKVEIENQYPGFLASGKRPPGYELDDALLPRVNQGLVAASQLANEDQPLAVVAHGGVMYVLEEHNGLGFARLSNLGSRWIYVDGDKVTLGDRIELLDSANVTTPDQI